MLAGGALAVRQDTAHLEEELLREAEATFAAAHPRPVHVDSAAPGTFGDAVALHLPHLEVFSHGTESERQALRGMAAGVADESTLPPALRTALVRADPPLDGLLAGTHAARADLPPSLQAYGPIDGTTWAGLGFTAVLAGVRIRRALAEGRAEAAAATCLDALALGRDAGIGGGLAGRMTGVTIISRLIPPCASALSAIPPSASRAMLARLRALRDALPSDAELLRVEFLSADLFTYAPLLDEVARSGLGPRATAIVKDGDRPTPLWVRMSLRDSWHATHSVHQSILRAAAAPLAKRQEALERAEKNAAKHWMNPIVHLQPSYLHFVRRADAASRRLDALAFALAARAFRAEHAAWPEDLGRLRDAGLATPDELERSGSARFEPALSGGLRINIPLPQTDPAKDEAEVVVSLHGV
jgi:hypothetical protein